MFKNALKITNNSIILTIPLILFVYILDLYSMFTRYSVDSVPKIILASLTVMFMFVVFCSAWFYLVKKIVDLSKKVFVMDTDRSKATFHLLRSMPEGIGEYFLSFLGVYFIFFVIQILVTPVVYALGIKLIGTTDATSLQSIQTLALGASASNSSNITLFVDKMTPEQLVFFGKWSLLLMLTTSVLMYLLMLWIPEIIYNTKNPLTALVKSIVKLFKDFLNTFRIYLILWILGFLLLFFNTFSMINPLLYLVMCVLMFYYITYAVVVIFLYYDKNYNAENDEK